MSTCSICEQLGIGCAGFLETCSICGATVCVAHGALHGRLVHTHQSSSAGNRKALDRRAEAEDALGATDRDRRWWAQRAKDEADRAARAEVDVEDTAALYKARIQKVFRLREGFRKLALESDSIIEQRHLLVKVVALDDALDILYGCGRD